MKKHFSTTRKKGEREREGAPCCRIGAGRRYGCRSIHEGPCPAQPLVRMLFLNFLQIGRKGEERRQAFDIEAGPDHGSNLISPRRIAPRQPSIFPWLTCIFLYMSPQPESLTNVNKHIAKPSKFNISSTHRGCWGGGG